ncbi:MAG: hypothetical protein L3J04_11250 [Robiginitomaculum sp.]|nr:hypothetical protein [Robiginitomaculum sp.]
MDNSADRRAILQQRMCAGFSSKGYIMVLCPTCFTQKFCRRWLVVTPDDLRNPYFVIDARNFIHGRMVRHNITPGVLLDRLLDTVSLMEGDFRNGAWVKIDLPTTFLKCQMKILMKIAALWCVKAYWTGSNIILGKSGMTA